MTRRLFPQLPLFVAQPLATEYAAESVETLRARAAHRHPQQIFSPTGGQQVVEGELKELAGVVRAVCNDQSEHVDAELSRIIHQRMPISRFESALDGVWSFLGCVLLPDVVRWRFSGPSTPTDRFLGAGRGVRNVFGRAWWRGELLFDDTPPNGRDNYWLVDALREDELTGIIERQRAVASRRVAVGLARALVSAEYKNMPRSEVARDAFKSYLRLGYFVEFDALTDEELKVACESLYRRSVKTLLQARERPLA